MSPVNYLIVGGPVERRRQLRESFVDASIKTCRDQDANSVVRFVKEHRNACESMVVLDEPTKEFFLDHEVRYCLMSSHHWGVSFVASIDENMRLPVIIKAAFDRTYVYSVSLDDYYITNSLVV